MVFALRSGVVGSCWSSSVERDHVKALESVVCGTVVSLTQYRIRHTVSPPYGAQSLDEGTRGFPDVESP
jgi:hypothetical protein